MLKHKKYCVDPRSLMVPFSITRCFLWASNVASSFLEKYFKTIYHMTNSITIWLAQFLQVTLRSEIWTFNFQNFFLTMPSPENLFSSETRFQFQNFLSRIHILRRKNSDSKIHVPLRGLVNLPIPAIPNSDSVLLLKM